MDKIPRVDLSRDFLHLAIANAMKDDACTSSPSQGEPKDITETLAIVLKRLQGLEQRVQELELLLSK